MKDFLVKIKIIRSTGMITFFGTFLLLAAVSLLFFVMAHVATSLSFHCERHINGLPVELRHSVNDACRDYVRAGVVERQALTSFLETHNIFYSDREVEGERGSVRWLGREIEYRVPYCLERSGDTCVYTISHAKEVAYHEMGHIILWATGLHAHEHHDFMHEHNLCPGRCSAKVTIHEPVIPKSE